MIADILRRAGRELSAGRLEEAARLCRKALDREPMNPAAMLLSGIVHVRSGQAEEALPFLSEAAKSPETVGDASLWMARAFRQLGQRSEALRYARTAARAKPSQSSSHHQLGLACLDSGLAEEALASFARAVELDPGVATLHNAHGSALRVLGRNTSAIESFHRASNLAPDSREALLNLYQALLDESEFGEAVIVARRLLELDPSDPHGHLRLCQPLLMENQTKEARNHLAQAMKLGSEDGNVCYGAGMVLQILGEPQQAEQLLRRSIHLTPGRGEAYSAIAYSRKMGRGDLDLIRAAQRLRSSEGLSDLAMSHVCYALGKSDEDLGEYATAAGHFDEANRLGYRAKFREGLFDRRSYADRIDLCIARSGNLELGSDRTPLGAGPAPVFVVGMLRSGTTLVEQILSCHDDVGSAGEQGFWLHNRDAPFPPGSRTPDLSVLGELGPRYLDRLAMKWPHKRLVVDKMPDNYLEAPLIHAALPQAKFIHCRRHPADTCLSIYTTINRLAIPWSHDKGNIVFAYREYERLMDRWRSVLPQGVMLEVDYEKLVSEPDRVIPQMIEFCDLDWNEACLHPEENRRSVATPSVWQVRQPINTSSIGRWRRYEPWLGAFLELL
jgi:tetratricopeptide (TPR) repeat protein